MQEIMPLLEKLAASLGVGVEKLWSALLAQASLNAAYHHSFVLFWTWTTVFAVILGILTWIAQVKDDSGDHVWLSTSVTAFSGAMLFFIFRLTENYAYLTAKYNAEYFACKQILYAIKKAS